MWRIFLLMLLLTACDSREGENTAASALAIQMQPVSYQQWQQVLSGYKPDIVVVDLWASWCISCIERFPHMVELERRYRDKGITFVSLNLDDRNDKEALEWATAFLNRINADFIHYHMDENLMAAFEQLDLLGIPVVLIYDRNGQERYRLTGDNPDKQFGERDVEEAVIALMNEA